MTPGFQKVPVNAPYRAMTQKLRNRKTKTVLIGLSSLNPEFSEITFLLEILAK
jgi:hypothetical protein